MSGLAIRLVQPRAAAQNEVATGSDVVCLIVRASGSSSLDGFTVQDACRLGLQRSQHFWNDNDASETDSKGSREKVVALVSPEFPLKLRAQLSSAGLLVLAVKGDSPREMFETAQSQLRASELLPDQETSRDDSGDLATPEVYLKPPFPLDPQAFEELVERHNLQESDSEYDD
jgi:hypothetical protein